MMFAAAMPAGLYPASSTAITLISTRNKPQSCQIIAAALQLCMMETWLAAVACKVQARGL